MLWRGVWLSRFAISRSILHVVAYWVGDSRYVIGILERQRTSVSDAPISPQRVDSAADDARTNGALGVCRVHLERDRGARQEPPRGLNERTAGADVHDKQRVPRTEAHLAPTRRFPRDAAVAPPFCQRGFHVPPMYRNVRLRPVTPKTRTAYCAPRAPRM